MTAGELLDVEVAMQLAVGIQVLAEVGGQGGRVQLLARANGAGVSHR
jgi:hypothetical protein